jgi:hypothetical protein
VTVAGGSNSYNSNYLLVVNAPNPNLRWEKVRTFNVGLDFGALKNRITGSVEYYLKRGTDLIGTAPLPGSSGFSTFLGNTADIKGRGWDIALNTINLMGKLKWASSFNLNFIKDWVTDYKVIPANNQGYVIAGITVGKPVNSIYSYRWAGLEHSTGNPQGYALKNVTTNYDQIFNSNDRDDLVYGGSSVPRIFGNLLNTFQYRALSLSFNINFKLNYYFRRNSINYYALYQGIDGGHTDYLMRWQTPGDEGKTSIPSRIITANSARDDFYSNSEILVERGDHIRFRDVQINYEFKQNQNKKLPFQKIRIYFYISNLGILWRANDKGIDPDVISSRTTIYTSPAGRSFAGGVKVDL